MKKFDQAGFQQIELGNAVTALTELNNAFAAQQRLQETQIVELLRTQRANGLMMLAHPVFDGRAYARRFRVGRGCQFLIVQQLLRLSRLCEQQKAEPNWGSVTKFEKSYAKAVNP